MIAISDKLIGNANTTGICYLHKFIIEGNSQFQLKALKNITFFLAHSQTPDFYSSGVSVYTRLRKSASEWSRREQRMGAVTIKSIWGIFEDDSLVYVSSIYIIK